MCTLAEKWKFLALTPLLQPSFLCFGVAKIAIYWKEKKKFTTIPLEGSVFHALDSFGFGAWHLGGV